MREPKVLAAHADEAVHMVVPGGNVRIANRPIDADAVAHICLEVQIAEAIDLTSPDDGLTTDLTRAQPVEGSVRGRAIRIEHVIGPEDVAHLIEARGVPLDRLPRGERAPVAEAAEVHVPRRNMFLVILLRDHVTSGLEYERAQTALAQLLGRP